MQTSGQPAVRTVPFQLVKPATQPSPNLNRAICSIIARYQDIDIYDMPKPSAPPSLNLKETKNAPQTENPRPLSPSTLSPGSPRSLRSNAGSPFLQEYSEATPDRFGTNTTGKSSTGVNGSVSPTLTAIPQYPPSPTPRHAREQSKSFFANLMASKSSHRLQAPDQSKTETDDRDRPVGRDRAGSKDRVLQSIKGKGSISDLRKNVRAPETQREPSADRKMPGSDTSSQPVDGPISQMLAGKKPKPRFGILNRSRSIKTDEPTRPKPSKPKRLDLSSPTASSKQFPEPMKTAPLRPERTFGDPVGSTHRNRSADRPSARRDGSQDSCPPRNCKAGGSITNSNSVREGAGANLLSNLHQTGRGAADKLGKAGKGFLGRITRSGSTHSTHERELVTDDNYTCSTINLPLVKQTRLTRIAKRLELSKDKTEFWMPALPWRCIE